MPCDEYGGKVSMGMRAEPVGTDKAAGPRRTGDSAPPVRSEPAFLPQPVPQVEPRAGSVPAESTPIFFEPPNLNPLQSPFVTQSGFVQSGPSNDTVFASYPGPLPLDPAYPESPPVDLPAPLFESPGPSADLLDTPEPTDRVGSRCRRLRGCLGEMCFEAKNNIWNDHRNYYDCETMAKLAYSLALGSVLANTSMDGDVQDWYQDDVRSSGTDHFYDFWKVFGDGRIFLPSYPCLAFACRFLEDRPIFGVTGEFSARVTRGYLVGAPSVLFMQLMLGASRPDESDHGSYWDPFQDTNSVSGHAFMGAVPFLTAANMTDSVMLKSGLYACSVLTGVSRINDNNHYLSQVILGWWMAYLVCEAVDDTQLKRRGMTFMPIVSTEMVGIGAICKF